MDKVEKKLKIKILVYAFIFLIALKFFDWLIFKKLYFSFPNELEWDTSPWYNFLHYIENIPNKEDPDKVFIAGSSVALYSVLPDKINKQKLNQKIQPYFFSHVAMAPTDFYYYLDKVISLKPSMVIYILNPADFQMEFLQEKDGKLFYNYYEWLRHFHWRNPTRLFYPFKFSIDYIKDLKKNEIYRLWAKSFLYSNRYREFLWDPILAYQERHFRSGRSYHLYTGSMPYEGIWQHGWTKPQFTIPCDFNLDPTHLILLRKESIFIPVSETTVQVSFQKNLIHEWEFKNPGWYSITLSIPAHLLNHTNLVSHPENEKIVLDLEWSMNKTYSSKLAEKKPYGKEYQYGIRLSQNFCKNELEQNIAYKRKEFLEDKRFQGMSIEEYERDYYQRIYQDAEHRPELSRLSVLSQAKILLNQHEFFLWIEIERLSSIRKRLEENGIRFILILSPENPLELNKYSKGEWYISLLDYLGESFQGHFFDYSRFFQDPRYFSDPHHLTYEGAVLFTKELEEVLVQEFHDEE